MKNLKLVVCLLMLIITFGVLSASEIKNKGETTPTMNNETTANPKVVFETNKGSFTLELYPDKAPITVQNFLQYVDDKFYDGTIFHRVIKNFMIQGGGFTPSMDQKETREQIKNEANNGLSNKKGTVAMARTMVVDSATGQFFINVVDNNFLDFKSETQQGYGYCVFGNVIDGLETVETIKNVETGSAGHYQDVPEEQIIVISAKRL